MKYLAFVLLCLAVALPAAVKANQGYKKVYKDCDDTCSQCLYGRGQSKCLKCIENYTLDIHHSDFGEGLYPQCVIDLKAICAGKKDGTPCDDGVECTVSVCKKNLCTVIRPAENGAPCTDGKACTTSDTCTDGKCIPGPPLVCTAADECKQSPGFCGYNGCFFNVRMYCQATSIAVQRCTCHC